MVDQRYEVRNTMHRSTQKKHSLSRLTLGTVQLGMPYGVANTSGQPDSRRAVAIIAAALEGGIHCFDTASAYGSSEEVLGYALRELNALDDAVIVTKVRHLAKAELADPARAGHAIEESVDTSRRRLGLDCIPYVLFHREADAGYVDVLESLRRRGWIGQVGVSLANTPSAPVQIDERFTAVQTPGNLLDRWPRSPDIEASLMRPERAVFLRSVFLQGLLVMPLDAVPPHLAAVLPVRKRLAAIAAQAGITEAALALRYSLSIKCADTVLIGVETPEQLSENIRIAESGPLDAEVLSAIDQAVTDVPNALCTPSVWPALARNRE